MELFMNTESWVFIVSFLEVVREVIWVVLKVDNESYHNIEGHRNYLHVPSLPTEQKLIGVNKK